MTLIFDAYIKTEAVVKSCKTMDQLNVAKKYCEYFSQLYAKDKDFKYFNPLVAINITFKINEFASAKL